MDTSEKHDRNSVPFLIWTVVIGIAIIMTAAVLLKKPPVTASPFDATPAPSAATPSTPVEAPATPAEPAAPK